jgi:DNA-binding transcriptional LysR family regulator
VAATPRIIVEDLPECVAEFRRRHPDVLLTVKERWDEQVHGAVEAGDADLGLAHGHGRDLLTPWQTSPWLEFDPLYELEVILVTPRDHPLARRRHVRLRDLAGYPLVNDPNEISDPVTMAVLDREGLRPAGPGLVEAFFNATVRRYVALGYGIGLIPALPARRPDPEIHERVMSRHFGRPLIYRLKRKGVPLSPQAVAFEEVVRGQLGRSLARGKKPGPPG